MIDLANITIRAGDGGGGAGSFRPTRGKKRGKADGGDGGRGGHVYLEATRDLNTLEPYRFIKSYKAKGGIRGDSNQRRGAEGVDLVLKVPTGTLAKYKSQSGTEQIVDIVDVGQKVLIARGGEGGRGNAHLRDEFGRRPFGGERGDEGESLEVQLELKLIADVGLIGFPNAGKSTLLSVLTHAKPQIAAYPFTTLEPNLGVYSVTLGKRIIFADIPGLIEGASSGRGLGYEFLRHIERTRVLVHLVDILTESDKWQDYQSIRGELKSYSTQLYKKKEIVVFNKADAVDEADIIKWKKVFTKKRKKVIVISALTKFGLEKLISAIVKLL